MYITRLLFDIIAFLFYMMKLIEIFDFKRLDIHMESFMLQFCISMPRDSRKKKT